jgi:hypothetical protein
VIGEKTPESDVDTEAHEQEENAHKAANSYRVVLVRIIESVLDDCGVWLAEGSERVGGWISLAHLQLASSFRGTRRWSGSL